MADCATKDDIENLRTQDLEGIERIETRPAEGIQEMGCADQLKVQGIRGYRDRPFGTSFAGGRTPDRVGAAQRILLEADNRTHRDRLVFRGEVVRGVLAPRRWLCRCGRVVEPSSMATSKSPDMPMESSLRWGWRVACSSAELAETGEKRGVQLRLRRLGGERS